jgi:glucan 1,3-beta-glucosidase
MVPPAQIAEDLAQLAKVTTCIRTYSTANGLDRVPELARAAGLKVLQGVWLANATTAGKANRQQIETVAELARNFPDVITGVVVGNEVLLRGEMTAQDLAANIRAVKARVGGMPVTYADVWEFWRENRELADAVDFITIHILPYWEDFPVRAGLAASHVDQKWQQMTREFPGREILLGESGWPSAGRMRAGALPSRINQATVVGDIIALAQRDNFRLNLIEAYDQPWKRNLEGTVGGYWGIFDAHIREPKFTPGAVITDYPFWRWQMAAGVAYAALIFTVGFARLRRRPWSPRWFVWPAIALWAASGGILLGIAAEKLVVESLHAGDFARSGLLLLAGFVAPLVAADALLTRRGLPALAELIGPREMRLRWVGTAILGVCLLLTAVLAAESALGFVFEPRYRDFPFASLTMAVVPFLGLAIFKRPRAGMRPFAELAFAGLFAAAAVYVVANEGIKNWQALWTCACFAALAFVMWQARVVQIRE